MCFGKSKKRKGQKKTKDKVPAKDPHVLAQDCDSTESEPVIVKPRPKLVSLTVTGAKQVAGDTYWALRDVASAQVRSH